MKVVYNAELPAEWEMGCPCLGSDFYDSTLAGACRSEFEAAILTDRAARAAKEVASTSGSEQSVITIALASSIPFVGMGAVDNAIMVGISSLGCFMCSGEQHSRNQ